jgi:PKD repeat protein
MNQNPRFPKSDSDRQPKVWRALTLMFLLLAVPLATLGQPSPYFEMLPQNLTVGVGASAVFSVTVGGALPLAYQWYYDGLIATNASGTTNATLTITNVQFSQGGYYWVVVTNVFGATTSNPALLTVTNPLAASFTANPTFGKAPLAVQFTGPRSDSAGNALVSWNWTFGDGAMSTAQNPPHTFETIGNFQPNLIVTNSNGTQITASGPSVSVASYLGLVFNGGFERGDFSGWTLDALTGQYDLVDTFNQSSEGMQPHTGSYFARLGQINSPGFLSQTLPTTAGGQYLLSFWLNSPDGSTPNSFLASWNGNTLFAQSNLPAFGTNGPAVAWTNL